MVTVFVTDNPTVSPTETSETNLVIITRSGCNIFTLIYTEFFIESECLLIQNVVGMMLYKECDENDMH